MADREAMIRFLGPTLPWAASPLMRCTAVRELDRPMAPGRRCELRLHGDDQKHALIVDALLLQWCDERPPWWRRWWRR